MRTIILAPMIFVLLLACSENENNPTQPVPVLDARYRLTFNATWSAQTHPNDFPPSPHFSGLIGMTHNTNAVLFTEGETASDGIKNMAERGIKDWRNRHFAWRS
jgi:hypothetical protein